jgi:hypothetical protein
VEPRHVAAGAESRQRLRVSLIGWWWRKIERLVKVRGAAPELRSLEAVVRLDRGASLLVRLSRQRLRVSLIGAN